ncbi:MAG: hypothetical protein PWP74_561 [Shewanella sp.]|nr:hypothetical protein [Shewanella sp.]
MDESSASGRMNHYEKGRHIPDIGTLRKLAEALGVPLSYFFSDDELSADLIIEMEKLSLEKKQQLLSLIVELQKSPK